MSKIDLSVIIPVYNEASLLNVLYERTTVVLKKIGLEYEIIFIDDGSTDNSLQILSGFHNINPKVKALSFSRNFGHQIAITAGLEYSRGRAAIVMDGDLQDPPEVIEAFVENWRKGYEVVYGIRTNRKEPMLKKALYKAYYKLLSRLANVGIPLDSGDFCLMDNKVVRLLNSFPERNRFVRGLRSWVGFKQAGLKYERDRRYAGKPKYTLFKLIKLGLDGIISFSGIPLKAAFVCGFFTSLFSLIYSFYIIINRIVNTANQIPGWTSIVVWVTFLGGIQLMVMGLLGEYISRIFDEVKRRPTYILSAAIGFPEENAKGLSNNPSI